MGVMAYSRDNHVIIFLPNNIYNSWLDMKRTMTASRMPLFGMHCSNPRIQCDRKESLRHRAKVVSTGRVDL